MGPTGSPRALSSSAASSSAAQQDLSELGIWDLKDLAALQGIGKPGCHLVLALHGRRWYPSAVPKTACVSCANPSQVLPVGNTADTTQWLRYCVWCCLTAPQAMRPSTWCLRCRAQGIADDQHQ